MDKKSLAVNLVLGAFLGICLFFISLKFVEAIPASGINLPSQISGAIVSEEAKLQVASAFFVAILGTVILLISNRRLALTIAGWIFAVFLIVFLLLNRDSKYLVLSYQTLRNFGYLYLVAYLIAHLTIHSTIWLLKRKREILTIAGVIHWFVLFFLITFAYALVVGN